MLRWTVSLAVLVAMLASGSDLMAQRRQPLRNLVRQFGVGWGTGHHWRNPGHDSRYYSPWTEYNTPSWTSSENGGTYQPGQIIQTPFEAPGESSPAPAPSGNSAPAWGDQHQTGTGFGNPLIFQAPQPGNALEINNRINRHLQPYHSKASNSSVLIHGNDGQFKINSGQTSRKNNGWNSRQYPQQGGGTFDPNR